MCAGQQMISLFKVANSQKRTNLNRVLSSGYLSQGPTVSSFESALNSILNTDFSVTVNSCTSAIDLAFKLIRDKDSSVEHCKVLTSPLTCTATNVPILHNGMTPLWCDINVDNFNICLRDLKNKLTAETRILIFVHWGGTPIDYDYLDKIRNFYLHEFGYPLYIIEDCAHAFGTTNIGHENYFSCFSFQAIKMLTTGDGGLLVPPADFYKQARILRWFGLDRDNNEDFRSCQDIKKAGFKYHMNDVNAAIGLDNLEEALINAKSHKKNALCYNGYIVNPLIKKPLFDNNSCFWLYTLLVDDAEKFIAYMKRNYIQCDQVHSRNDKYSCFANSATNLRHMDSIENKYVCIPVGWWLNDAEKEHIVRTVNQYG